MTTFVGTQSDFSKALQELLELEYEALEIYKTAINRIEDIYKQGLVNAKNDHNRHMIDLIKIFEDKEIDVPKPRRNAVDYYRKNNNWLTISNIHIKSVTKFKKEEI